MNNTIDDEDDEEMREERYKKYQEAKRKERDFVKRDYELTKEEIPAIWKLLDRVNETFEDDDVDDPEAKIIYQIHNANTVMKEVKKINNKAFFDMLSENHELKDKYERKLVEWVIKHGFCPDGYGPSVYGYRYVAIARFGLFIKHREKERAYKAFEDYCERGPDNLKYADSKKVAINYYKLERSFVMQVLQGANLNVLDDPCEEYWHDIDYFDEHDLNRPIESMDAAIKHRWSIMKNCPKTFEEFFFVKKVCPDTGAILELDWDKMRAHCPIERKREEEERKHGFGFC